MSDLLKKFARVVENTGVPSNPISFFFFLLFWFLGYLVGLFMVIMGMDVVKFIGKYGDNSSEIDEMIARMNEQGPNN